MSMASFLSAVLALALLVPTTGIAVEITDKHHQALMRKATTLPGGSDEAGQFEGCVNTGTSEALLHDCVSAGMVECTCNRLAGTVINRPQSERTCCLFKDDSTGNRVCEAACNTVA